MPGWALPVTASVAQLVGTPTLERHSNGTSLVYTAYSWHDLFWQCPQMKPGIPIEAASGATINSAQGFNWAMMLREPYPMEIAVRDHREDIFNRTEYVKLWARYGGNLQTFREETWWQWVTDSSIDIDAEWPGVRRAVAGQRRPGSHRRAAEGSAGEGHPLRRAADADELIRSGAR